MNIKEDLNVDLLTNQDNKITFLTNIINKILSDQEYLDIMKNIDDIKFITDGKWDWEHGIGHAKRVAGYIEKILIYLNCDDELIKLGIIAGLLHDIGLAKGDKEDHAKESSLRSKNYLLKFNIDVSDIDLISAAIADHSNGNNINSIIGAALLLADKLDVTFYRVKNSSVKDEFNNEFLKIKDVFIHINQNELIIEYITEATFNELIFVNWKKPILVTLKVAEYLHRNCIFKINGEVCDLTRLLEK